MNKLNDHIDDSLIFNRNNLISNENSHQQFSA